MFSFPATKYMRKTLEFIFKLMLSIAVCWRDGSVLDVLGEGGESWDLDTARAAEALELGLGLFEERLTPRFDLVDVRPLLRSIEGALRFALKRRRRADAGTASASGARRHHGNSVFGRRPPPSSAPCEAPLVGGVTSTGIASDDH